MVANCRGDSCFVVGQLETKGRREVDRVSGGINSSEDEELLGEVSVFLLLARSFFSLFVVARMWKKPSWAFIEQVACQAVADNVWWLDLMDVEKERVEDL